MHSFLFFFCLFLIFLTCIYLWAFCFTSSSSFSSYPNKDELMDLMEKIKHWKIQLLKVYVERKNPKSRFYYTIYYQKLIDSCWVRFRRKELVSKDAEKCPTTRLATTTTTNKYWTVIRPRVSIEYYAFQMSTNAICLIFSHGCDWVVA